MTTETPGDGRDRPLHLGYSLSTEEHAPRDLVRYAQAAEDAGFVYASISDHFHPWIAEQGNSPFVWTVIGAIAAVTERLELGPIHADRGRVSSPAVATVREEPDVPAAEP